MKRKAIFALFLLMHIILISNCSKEEDEVPDDLIFQSLVAEKDTISPGETVKITATATGSQLAYFWSATLGDIIGSGAEIIYAASPCSVGKNKVTCKVTNGRKQMETKTIDIVVYE